MQFLYQLHPVRLGLITQGPTEAEAEVLSAHRDYLQAAAYAGIVLMAGRTISEDEHVFGLCVFQMENEAEAETFMENDPVIAEGIMRATLHPYRVAVWSEKGPYGLV